MSKYLSHGKEIYKSEIIKNDNTPAWNTFKVNLTRGDMAVPIKIDVFDHDKIGKDDLIGSFATNLHELSEAESKHSVFELVDPGKAGTKKGYKNSGEVFVKEFKWLG